MHSIIVEKRRKRSINFTESDRQILLELVTPHLSVIENKRTDKFTSKLKSETWENIKVQYNKISTQPRTALQLKLFYEANKYKAKKKEVSATQSDDSESPAKIVKIEVETSSIMNILAKNDKAKNANEKSSQIESQPRSNEKIENNEAKIKVVDISKLRTASLSPTKNRTPPISSTSEIQLQDHVKIDNLFKVESPSSTILSDTLFPGLTLAPCMQEELHKMRMLILQDERNFRRQEHLKRMEYIDLNILAVKSSIFRQNT